MLRPASREDETMITDHFINLRYAGAESPHHLALQCGELTQIAVSYTHLTLPTSDLV